MAVNCNDDDIASLGGTCNQDCEAPPECGDGICDPLEASVDADVLAAQCTAVCAGAPDTSCAVDCMISQTGMSSGCATCSAEAMACVFGACSPECVDETTSDDAACETCVFEQGVYRFGLRHVPRVRVYDRRHRGPGDDLSR